ncbi:hypothetical protein ABZ297_30915 [Nonomuraea sp. NPDC005983]|uniref:hypothetical protein n=1 Tax=Nonomuraea sp. NPDC005983 TaxID=3155595 RepID=UPI0033A5277F
MGTDLLPLLWLSGPSGVGKSSVGWEIFAQLSRSGVKAAFVDSDQISLCYPAPEGGTHRIRAHNLAALWANLQREGMQCLVLAGFVDTPEEVREYTGLLPDAMFSLCRLRVASAELRERFLARGWRPDLVEEAVAEAEALDRGRFPDVCVDTDGLAVSEVAQLVRERMGGWPWARPAATPRGLVDRQDDTPPPQVDAVLASAKVPLLWFSGATAVGKSTIGYEVFRHIYRAGVRVAYVDVKQIAALRLSADDDADRYRLKTRNLAALWARYRAVGAEYLIVSGEPDSDETVRGYADLLPDMALTVCRLHASPATLLGRVAQRGRGGGPALPGDQMKGLDQSALRRVAEQAAREAEALDRAGAGDLRIDTDGRSVQQVAAEVMVRLELAPGLDRQSYRNSM